MKAREERKHEIEREGETKNRVWGMGFGVW
jgi:hypothetical protein